MGCSCACHAPGRHLPALQPDRRVQEQTGRCATHAWAVGVFIIVAVVGLSATPASPSAAQPACLSRVLVVGAMPLEVHPFLRAGTFDAAGRIELGGRAFFLGQLAGHEVALAMTGIGMVNAEQTVATAVEHLACGVSAVLFSGVAGSRRSVGEVAVAERWTPDGGVSWFAADAELLDRARAVADDITLDRQVPVGDDACLCPGVETVPTPIDLGFDPRVWVGGDGTSGDTLDGLAMPCVPGGGDVFGCRACTEPGATAADIADFAANPPSLEFLENFLQYPEQTTDTYEAQDMESAAAARAAAAAGLPFVAVRGVSDGVGDPLNLPGFPFQFFVYRHLAADNAARVTLAMLEGWAAMGQADSGFDARGDEPPRQPLPASGGGIAAAAMWVLAVIGRRRSSRVAG